MRPTTGDLARALVIKDGTEAELVQDEQDTQVDTSGWHLELVVNKLQGTEYFRQRLIITADVIAMGNPTQHMFSTSLVTKNGKHTWDDVLPLHQVTSVREIEGKNKEAAEEEQAPDEQGLLGIYTEAGGHNKGRKYCVQIVGMHSTARKPCAGSYRALLRMQSCLVAHSGRQIQHRQCH